MNEYIVISNAGWYAEKVLKDNPNYCGIDRFPWPLCNDDVEKMKNLPLELKEKAMIYLEEIGGIYRIDENVFCNNFKHVQTYEKLCKMLQIHTEILVCKRCISNSVSAVESKMPFEFLGWEYVLKDSTYSCIIHEKALIDKDEKIRLNSNGLLGSVDDAKKFICLEANARKENIAGLEKGEVEYDFELIEVSRNCVQEHNNTRE